MADRLRPDGSSFRVLAPTSHPFEEFDASERGVRQFHEQWTADPDLKDFHEALLMKAYELESKGLATPPNGFPRIDSWKAKPWSSTTTEEPATKYSYNYSFSKEGSFVAEGTFEMQTKWVTESVKPSTLRVHFQRGKIDYISLKFTKYIVGMKNDTDLAKFMAEFGIKNDIGMYFDRTDRDEIRIATKKPEITLDYPRGFLSNSSGARCTFALTDNTFLWNGDDNYVRGKNGTRSTMEGEEVISVAKSILELIPSDQIPYMQVKAQRKDADERQEAERKNRILEVRMGILDLHARGELDDTARLQLAKDLGLE